MHTLSIPPFHIELSLDWVVVDEDAINKSGSIVQVYNPQEITILQQTVSWLQQIASI